MTKVLVSACVLLVLAQGGLGCGSQEADPTRAAPGADDAPGTDAVGSAGGDAGSRRAPQDGNADGGSSASNGAGAGPGRRDAGRAPDASTSSGATISDDASTRDAAGGAPGGASDGGSSRGSDASASEQTCALPTTFKWTSGGPLAQPKNGWLAMKDFTHVFYKDQHIVYYTTYQTGWGSGMMTFKDWPDAAAAPQIATSFGVAPTLFFFAPKSIWVIAYQWGPHKFSYRTSADPTNPSGWSAEKSLYNTALPAGGTGPIDQTVICDSTRCYLYYAGDNGHIYKSSMPIGNFPGEFPPAEDSGIAGTTQNLFEAVQVYTVQGSDAYLMIVEAQGSGRYFRAWTAKDLAGPWTLLTNEFAIKKNVAFSTSWTDDISHGDLVRSSPDQTFPIDPCNLQLVFQGRDPSFKGEYGKLPYRLGLLTLAR